MRNNVPMRVMSFDDLDENEAYGLISWTTFLAHSICI